MSASLIGILWVLLWRAYGYITSNTGQGNTASQRCDFPAFAAHDHPLHSTTIRNYSSYYQRWMGGMKMGEGDVWDQDAFAIFLSLLLLLFFFSFFKIWFVGWLFFKVCVGLFLFLASAGLFLGPVSMSPLLPLSFLLFACCWCYFAYPFCCYCCVLGPVCNILFVIVSFQSDCCTEELRCLYLCMFVVVGLP